MKVLKIRRGHAPNCSASGSVVGIALVSATVGAAVLNAWAHRFLRWVNRPGGDPPTLRREGFGGVLRVEDPPGWLYLDEEGAVAAEDAGATVVGRGARVAGALTAPIEVHVSLTSRCPVRCAACYLDAGPDGVDPAPDALLADLERLAADGVLEVALGGGEVLLRDDLVPIARRIRQLGMVPNLTTSGLGLTDARAADLAEVVGQVNVSVDGLPGTYAAVRGWEGASHALTAIGRLKAAGLRVGANTVLTRANVDTLDALADALVQAGVDEWQWLRLKPAGRGREVYASQALEPAQAEALWPRLLAIEARTGLTLRIDCALVPFVVAHQPPLELVERLGLTGCPGGESLWARSTSGVWSPCSFAAADGAGDWATDATLQAWRKRAADPPEPCASCAYRGVCRGGCRVVSGFLTGDPLAPDPECPRVRGAA